MAIYLVIVPKHQERIEVVEVVVSREVVTPEVDLATGVDQLSIMLVTALIPLAGEMCGATGVTKLATSPQSAQSLSKTCKHAMKPCQRTVDIKPLY